MDLVSILATLVRRWYVTLPVVAIGAVGAFVVANTADADYEVEGTFLLTNNPIGLEAEATDEEVEPDGVLDAPLLAAALGLDQRSLMRGEATGPVFSTSVLGEDTIQIDGWADDEAALTGLLDDLFARSESALASGLELVVVARSAPIPSVGGAATRGSLQGGMLLRVVGGAGTSGIGEGLSTGFVGRVLSEMMLAGEAQAEVLAGGERGTGMVSTQERDQAPIVQVSAISTSPADAFSIYARTVEVANERLELIQDAQNVSERQRLQLSTLVEPVEAAMIEDHGRRPALMLFGLTLAVAAGLALAVDTFLRSRHERGGGGEDGGRDDGPDPSHHGGDAGEPNADRTEGSTLVNRMQGWRRDVGSSAWDGPD